MKTTACGSSLSSGTQSLYAPQATALVGNERSGEHPASVLLAAHRAELRSNRARLLREVRNVSRPLALVASQVLRKRDLLTPPAIGEVWPWLVGDLVSLPAEKVRNVAKAWLAIYLYTLLLDKACDAPEDSSEPTETLTGALLFELGLGDFLLMTAGTDWQNVVRDAVRCSIRDQELDVRMAGQMDDLDMKRQTAAGKNAGFAMCTAALSAVSQMDKPLLDRFARSVLLAFQHLDDVADFETDWRRGNFTPLLIGARNHLGRLDRGAAARLAILEALVLSGALRDILSESKSILQCGLHGIADTYSGRSGSKALCFFGGLITALEETVAAIDRSSRLLSESPDAECRELLLAGIDKHLRVVAQQS